MVVIVGLYPKYSTDIFNPIIRKSTLIKSVRLSIVFSLKGIDIPPTPFPIRVSHDPMDSQVKLYVWLIFMAMNIEAENLGREKEDFPIRFESIIFVVPSKICLIWFNFPLL